MDSREYCNNDELTIDFAHLVASLLKKWRSIVVLTLVGALLGAALQWGPQHLSGETEPVRSQEDAALVERLQVIAADRLHYEELKDYVTNSAFMQLDSSTVFTGNGRYFVTQCNEPEMINDQFNAIFEDPSVRDTLAEILDLNDARDLKMMVWNSTDVHTDTRAIDAVQVEIKEEISLVFGVYAASREQAQQAMDFLCKEIEKLSSTLAPEQAIRMVKVCASVNGGGDIELIQEQSELLRELSNAYDRYYYEWEEELSSEQYALYEEYFLTGRTEELPIDLFPSNPLKKPIFMAVIFGFLSCAWYAMAYLLSGKVKTPDDVLASTGRNLLAFIDTRKPRKLALDRAIEKLENHSFPLPVDEDYVVAAIEKLGNAVVVYDRQDEILKEAAQKLSGRIPCMGLLGLDAETLNCLQKDNQVVILARAGGTTKDQLWRESALCRQYGISLAGSVLVK